MKSNTYYERYLKFRDGFILWSIDNNIPPVVIGRDLAISRERVRQIYKRQTGKNPEEVKPKTSEEVKYLISHYFCCLCGTRFKSGTKKYFCSNDCKTIFYQRDRSCPLICVICKQKYLPFRNRTSPSVVEGNTLGRTICSRDCQVKYFAYISKIKSIKKVQKKLFITSTT